MRALMRNREFILFGLNDMKGTLVLSSLLDSCFEDVVTYDATYQHWKFVSVHNPQNEDEKRSFNELQDEDIKEMLLTVEAVLSYNKKKSFLTVKPVTKV